MRAAGNFRALGSSTTTISSGGSFRWHVYRVRNSSRFRRGRFNTRGGCWANETAGRLFSRRDFCTEKIPKRQVDRLRDRARVIALPRREIASLH